MLAEDNSVGKGYFLGVDGGATKTKSVVCDSRGSVLGSGLAGGSNHHVIGIEAAKANLDVAIRAAIQQAGIVTDQIAAICLGAAGVDSPSDKTLLEQMVRQLGFSCPLLIAHDGAIALMGATGGHPGVVVIGGTGALAFGINEVGESCRASGWGYLLGDEGSGYDIGRRGIIAALWAYDGRGPETILLERLISYFHLGTVRDLVNRVYEEKMPPQEIASFAQVVAQAAEEGDPVAARILQEAGELLALSALAVLRRLCMDKERTKVAAAGSVLQHNAIVRQAFEEVLQREAPNAHVISPRYEPAVGAALLAIQRHKAIEKGVQDDATD